MVNTVLMCQRIFNFLVIFRHILSGDRKLSCLLLPVDLNDFLLISNFKGLQKLHAVGIFNYQARLELPAGDHF